MELRVTSREAAASLEELLDRVSGGGDTVVIEREGMVVGQLVPPVPATGRARTMRDLVEFLRTMPRQDDGWAEGVEEAIRLGNQPMTLPETE